mmetsp:Transcript_42379/g.117973  ORF Transcript_42379/g.117973 Transcript_42379/m.117973 type:complete len:279 (+) Transcript_42379:1314-2150(+)
MGSVAGAAHRPLRRWPRPKLVTAASATPAQPPGSPRPPAKRALGWAPAGPPAASPVESSPGCSGEPSCSTSSSSSAMAKTSTPSGICSAGDVPPSATSSAAGAAVAVALSTERAGSAAPAAAAVPPSPLSSSGEDTGAPGTAASNRESSSWSQARSAVAQRTSCLSSLFWKVTEHSVPASERSDGTSTSTSGAARSASILFVVPTRKPLICNKLSSICKPRYGYTQHRGPKHCRGRPYFLKWKWRRPRPSELKANQSPPGNRESKQSTARLQASALGE